MTTSSLWLKILSLVGELSFLFFSLLSHYHLYTTNNSTLYLYIHQLVIYIIYSITSSVRLGIRGGSNGGLLMGNMITRRPDLFGAVCCAVPLLDMHRYHTLLAGASWMAEYGDPSTSDWSYLQQYSAYHNISPSGARTYPPLLMTTSTRDDRVHPYHARSFVKRLLGDLIT